MKPRIIIDTNVIISALKSRNGASNKLITLMGSDKFETCLSVPLLLEYEEVLRQKFTKLGNVKICQFLDYFCKISKQQKIHYLWRPQLRDPDDEMVLELAVAARAKFIVTYNLKDFKNITKFNLKAITAKQFLQHIGEIK